MNASASLDSLPAPRQHGAGHVLKPCELHLGLGHQKRIHGSAF